MMKKLLVLLSVVLCAYSKPAENVKYWQNNPEYGVGPDIFEGDIIIDDYLRSMINDNKSAIVDTNRLWTDKTLVYTISSDYTEDERQLILAGLNDIASKTCIKFRESTPDDVAYCYVEDGGGCSSYIGMTGAPQRISLARGCFRHGTIMHEFIHALGFYHEQSRPDRDNHVTIQWDNISPGTEGNFGKCSETDGVGCTTQGTAYDYDSCMHYGGTAFSINGEYTIVTTNPDDQDRIGQRTQLSTTDVEDLKKLYSCP